MLYFVATPIGNLGDFSLRAIETLQSVDIIACEDTRNSMKLLLRHDIHKKLIAYHKFNEKNSADGIVSLLRQGKNIAVISDSGMPVISDPGSVLIQRLREEKLEYTVVPGANAGLCALLLSGFDATRYTFVGFLPEQNRDRKNLVLEIKEYSSTLLFYVSPHSLEKDIAFLYESLGQRKACLANEITKLHEKTLFFELGDELEIEPRGEYVLVVEGKKGDQKLVFETTVEDDLKELISQGMRKNDAIKEVAKKRNLKKQDVYAKAINLEEK